MEAEKEIDKEILSGIDFIHISLIFRAISSVVLIVTGETLFSFLVISDKNYDPVYAYAALIGLVVGVVGLFYMRRGFRNFIKANDELKIGFSGVSNEISGLILMILAIIMAFIGHSYSLRFSYGGGYIDLLLTHIVLFIVGVILAIVGVSLIFVSFFRLGLSKKDDVLILTSIVFVISAAIGYAILGLKYSTELLAMSITGIFALYYGLYSLRDRIKTSIKQ